MPEIRWQKSSYSTEAEANCVELARHLGAVLLLRESEAPDAVLSATADGLRALILTVKDGQPEYLA
jgi:hypothetical protein